MKKWIYIFMVVALCMVVFNIFQIQWETPFEGRSLIASIGVLAASCALLLLIVLERSLVIRKKLKGK